MVLRSVMKIQREAVSGGFTLWRKLNKREAIILFILHGRLAPFKFEKQRYNTENYFANKSVWMPFQSTVNQQIKGIFIQMTGFSGSGFLLVIYKSSQIIRFIRTICYFRFKFYLFTKITPNEKIPCCHFNGIHCQLLLPNQQL